MSHAQEALRRQRHAIRYARIRMSFQRKRKVIQINAPNLNIAFLVPIKRRRDIKHFFYCLQHI